MPAFLALLTSVAAIIGPVVTLIGLFRSRGWLAGIGALLACSALAALVYAREQGKRVAGATVEIEGISIDTLNAANLRRRVSKGFMVQAVRQSVTIEGKDLRAKWQYAGYCRGAAATTFEFSVDAEPRIPFSDLHCFGFDLKADPEGKHRIQPILIGPDGISKKIAVPFVQPLVAQQPFDIALECHLPGIFKPAGVSYYISTLSFDQQRVGQCAVEFTFIGKKPAWVRVYDCDRSGRPRLLKSLYPLHDSDDASEYRDVVQNVPAQSVRIYLFKRV